MRNKLWLKIIIGVVALGIIGVVAVPFVYIHFIKDDAPESVESQGLPTRTNDTTSATADTTAATTATTTAATTASTTAADTAATAATTAGTTAATAAATGTAENYTLTMSDDVSVNYVGYRVVEVLFGQDTEGVGRTTSVTGSLTLDGAAITAAEFTVDMTTLKSDEDNRDKKFQGEIMETSTFPTATFTITQPIELGTVPADGTEITATATGDLTLHGVTKSVTLEVKAQRNGDIIDVLGSTNVLFADYDIDNPSNGAVTTQDNGTIEFLLTFTKA